MTAIIEAHNLTKTFRVAAYQRTLRGLLSSALRRRYREVEAVRDVSFRVEPGICLGLIGPNGAGKSTTIKIMTGVLHPTAGEVRVNGLAPYADRQRNARQIGVVFGQRSQLWYDLPVIDSYDLLRQIYEIPRATYERNLRVYGERLGLDAFIEQPVRKLSLGQRMRADFAAALLHDPRVVFLDEPTIGLDVVAREAVRDAIRFMSGERGVTVILTTHDMSDVEAVSQRVLVLDSGAIIHDSTMAALRDAYAQARIVAVRLREPQAATQLAADHALLGRLGVAVAGTAEGAVALQFDRARFTAYELVAQVARHYAVEDIETRDVPIEAIIRSIYTGGARGRTEAAV